MGDGEGGMEVGEEGDYIPIATLSPSAHVQILFLIKPLPDS